MQADTAGQNRYIVMFKEQPTELAGSRTAQATVEKNNTVFSALGISKDSLIHQYKWASSGFAGYFSPDQVDRLRKNPLVDHVVKDYYYKAIDAIPASTPPPVLNMLASFSQSTP